MKNFILISACLLSLLVNAQARLGSKAQDIYEEFKDQCIEYENDIKSFYLIYYFNDDLIIQYYFDKDSICDRVLIQTISQEMTDFIVSTYDVRGYFRIKDGWLPRINGIICRILHIVKENDRNLFLWL